MTRTDPIYGANGDKNTEDFPSRVVELAREIASSGEIVEASTAVDVTVRETDTSVGAEVYVREYGNAGLRVDETSVPPAMAGDGSPVSKRAQDIARERLGHSGHRVTQYEDDTRSETTITPTAA